MTLTTTLRTPMMQASSPDSWTRLGAFTDPLDKSTLKNLFSGQDDEDGDQLSRRTLKVSDKRDSQKEQIRKQREENAKLGYANWSKLSFVNYLNNDRKDCNHGDCSYDYNPITYEDEYEDNEEDEQTIVIKIVPVLQPYRYNPRNVYTGRYNPNRSNAAENRMIGLTGFTSEDTGSQNRRSGYGYGGGGGNGLAILYGLLPLILLGGLSVGFLFGSQLNGSGGGASVNNTIIINGTSITNTFIPTNEATQMNTDEDTDTITIDQNNVNTNRRRKKRSSNEQDQQQLSEKIMALLIQRMFEFFGYKSIEGQSRAFSVSGGFLLSVIKVLFPYKEELSRALGLNDLSSFLPKFILSALRISPYELLRDSGTILRKLDCIKSNSLITDCLNRVVCEHFKMNHNAFNGNLLLRTEELLTVLAASNLGPEEAVELMDSAVDEKCSEMYNECIVRNVAECLVIY